jgi:hypothetical protein
MDALLVRYFDGDLNEHEAREFLDRVEADPKLEKELRAYEQLLAVGKTLPTPEAPEGFTERVMTSVAAEERPVILRQKRVYRDARWAGLAVAAAAAVFAFVGGWWSGINLNIAPLSRGDASQPMEVVVEGVSSTFVNQASATDAADRGYQYVRFAYVPSSPDVKQVTVVGNFNNWNPNDTPLRRQNGAWSTILVLPPGSYEYMFVEDGERWVTDPLAAQTRDDGFGGANAVIDVEL